MSETREEAVAALVTERFGPPPPRIRKRRKRPPDRKIVGHPGKPADQTPREAA